MKGRRIDDEVVEVLAAGAGMSCDDDVARLKAILAELGDAVSDRRIEIAHEQRQAAWRLCDQARCGIENSGAEVLHLVDDRAMRSSRKIDRHFFGVCDQRIADDFNGHGVDSDRHGEFPVRQFWPIVMIRLPPASA